MALVDFNYKKDGVSFRFSLYKGLYPVLISIAHDFELKSLSLSVVFTSDQRLRAINKKHLGHNYFTDIITFDLSDDPQYVHGELFVSIDRVKENARVYGVRLSNELCRVIIHGVLHLVGIGDKTKSEQLQMRHEENKYLKMVCFT